MNVPHLFREQRASGRCRLDIDSTRKCWNVVVGDVRGWNIHSDVIMSPRVSQITGVSMVCSTVCSGADHRKHQSSPSLAFMRGIHRWPVNSPHKVPVARKMFSFDDVIMKSASADMILLCPLKYLGHKLPIAPSIVYYLIQFTMTYFYQAPY